MTEGKDRPCVIVAANRRANGEIAVLLAPITHTPPDREDETSLPVDPALSTRLGLDRRPQWFRVHELNRFTWPGFDLRPVPGGTGDAAYGMLPQETFEAVLSAVRRLDATRRRVQVRD